MESRKRLKRKNLSIQEKTLIFTFMDQNPQMKKNLVAEKFQIPTSTLSTILKNRKDVEEKALQGNVNRKRVREAKYADLEKILAEWLHKQRSQNIPIDGVILRMTAKEIALQIGCEDFTASNGWIGRFQKRYEIKYKISGESEEVDSRTINTWKNDVLPGFLKDYAPKDIFNADELGLFFNLAPDKNMIHRTETCHGGKRSKERVTVLLACNQDGSEKLKPLMIGKSKSLRCFKNIRYFPCEYSYNRKAWMTVEQYQQWLKRLDAKMRDQQRKIILLIDNCPAHPKDLGFLTNVRVEFLPPNTTSHTQPLGMGCIKIVKHHYRQKLVRRLLNLFSGGEELQPKDWRIDLYQAMHYIAGSWDAITPAAIQNCFRKAGFENLYRNNPAESQRVKIEEVVEHELDPNTALDCPRGSYTEVTGRWEEIQQFFNCSVSFEDFVAADDFTPICEVSTIEEIINTLRKGTEEREHSQMKADPDDPASSESDEGDSGDSTPPVLRSEAMHSLERFRRYVGQHAGADEEIFRMINKLENLVITAAIQNIKQETLYDFF